MEVSFKLAGILTDKKIIVMGVANKHSIAWGCAQAMAAQGATIIYTYQNERLKRSVSRLVKATDNLVECDVADDNSIQNAFQPSINGSAPLMELFTPLLMPRRMSWAGLFLTLVVTAMPWLRTFHHIH